MAEKTCGPLYFDGLKRWTNGDPALVRAYAAGFVNGNSEKVYLGACRAAMFRPSEEFHAMVLEQARDAAERYGLRVEVLGTSQGDEIWMCRDVEAQAAIRTLPDWGENTPQWHLTRATLCGIPAYDVDLSFHLRKGYGVPCDRMEATP